jgi:tyrosyl-tRNA synthetase
MMWRYYELLTDVQVAEIETMKRETHPMQAKKDLARRIVADFHSAEAAAKAGEDWAKLRQRELVADKIPQDIEEVRVPYEKIRTPDSPAPGTDAIIVIRLDRLLVVCGLVDSNADAGRKLKARAVELLKPDGSPAAVYTAPRLPITSYSMPFKLILRVGKKVKAAIIEA